MKNHLILIFVLILLSASASAQFSKTVTAVVDSGDSISVSADMQTYRLAAIQIPAAMENDSVYFQTCDAEAGTYLDVYLDDQTKLKVDAYRGQFTIVQPKYFFAFKRYVKLVFPQHVAASSGRTITLLITSY